MKTNQLLTILKITVFLAEGMAGILVLTILATLLFLLLPFIDAFIYELSLDTMFNGFKIEFIHDLGSILNDVSIKLETQKGDALWQIFFSLLGMVIAIFLLVKLSKFLKHMIEDLISE